MKGTIWFVNISNYRNTNIELTTEIQGHSLNDFLGSSIDIGFRLSRFSSTEKITISVETAILLMRDNYLTLEEKGINVYFDGTTKLKGLGPLICDYPILWIDLLDKKKLERLKTSDDSSKLQILKREIQKTNLSNLMEYCQTFIKSRDEKLIYPQIPGDRLFSPHV